MDAVLQTLRALNPNYERERILTNIEIENILADYDVWYRAYRSSLNRRSYKLSALQFTQELYTNLDSLRRSVVDKTYRVKGYNQFKVYKPKEREIKACLFEDKIVQHVLCDNILIKYLPHICIDDNCAGQLNKGTSYCNQRTIQHMSNFYNLNRGSGYIYKGDISKYYYNVNHQIAKQVMHFYYPSTLHWLIDVFIDSTGGDVGVALGNQINTIVTNLYLDMLDKFVVNRLHLPYCRYADDFFILCNDKEYLKHCVSRITQLLSVLKLNLNPKSQIIKFNNGLKFVGFHFYANSNGITIKLLNKKKREYNKKFNKLYHKVCSGELGFDKLHKSYVAYLNHCAIITDKSVLDYYKNQILRLQRRTSNDN